MRTLLRLLLSISLAGWLAAPRLRAEPPAQDGDVQTWLSGRTLAQADEEQRQRQLAAEQAARTAASVPSAPPQPRSAPLLNLRPADPRHEPAPVKEPQRAAASQPRPELAPQPVSPEARAVVQTGRSEGERALLAVMLVAAEKLAKTHGIPPAATIAMALHESGYGHSKLAAKHHNYFGLKIGKAVGDFVRMPTKELGRMVKADFRTYRSLEQGILGFATFLKYPRYRPAFTQADGRAFISSLLRAGYCPEPDYMACIQEIYRRHQLNLIDPNPAASGTASTPNPDDYAQR